MDDIIDTLRSLNEEVPVPLDLPSEDDLIEAESQMLIKIPADYRTYLLEASDVVLGHIEPATLADPNAHTYLPELAALAWNQGLPRHLLPVCMQQQMFYVVDPDGVIHGWSKKGFIDETWDSLWEWIEEYWIDQYKATLK
jgi:hypothetical protein